MALDDCAKGVLNILDHVKKYIKLKGFENKLVRIMWILTALLMGGKWIIGKT